jgi:DNA polymerase-3 subunit beta
MKVIVDRAALLDAVNLVSGAVAARTPKIQLTCIKVTAVKAPGGNEVTLEATDGEISIRLSLSQVDVLAGGAILLPADKFRGIVAGEENEPTLTLETVGADHCLIKGSDAKFDIVGFAPDDFPPIHSFADAVSGGGESAAAKATITHPAGSLAELVARTLFATARESSRYAINGVLFKRDGKRLEMVSTDGRRLALARASLTTSEKDAKPVQCIVPTKALGMLQKLIKENDEAVQIAITENQIFFSFGTAASPGRAVLISNLVEGSFPPYDDVIPKDNDKKVTFDRDVLLSAVRRAAVLTNEESRGVKMSFNPKEKQLEISSRAPEQGEANIRVDLIEYNGDAMEIGFNPTFITDALKIMTEQQVVMELKASGKPGMIRSGNEFLYVVMPVSLT